MSFISDDTSKKDELISNMNEDKEIEIANEKNEKYKQLNFHLENLEKDIYVIESIYEIPKTENWENNLTHGESMEKNPEIMKNICKNYFNYKSVMTDIDNVNKNLIGEIEHLKKELKEKINENNFLKKELKEKLDENNNLKQETISIKYDKNENINQVNIILKELSTKSRKHTLSYDGSSSLNNYTNTSHNPPSSVSHLDYEKIVKEKLNLEQLLVNYKLKYAEQSSKILELQDENENLKKKLDASSDKFKLKDDIIKNLITERDNLKYSSISKNNSDSKNNSNVNNLTERNTDQKNFRSKKGSKSPSNIKNNFKENIINMSYSNTVSEYKLNYNDINLNNYNSHYLNTFENLNKNTKQGQRQGQKTSGSFVTIIKNIFTSEKK